MKITVPQTAIDTLKSIIEENSDAPKDVRVYFAGISCSGPSFGLALDAKTPEDVHYEEQGIKFIMAKEEFDQFGDPIIEDTGTGFRVITEKTKHLVGGDCSTCGGGCH